MTAFQATFSLQKSIHEFVIKLINELLDIIFCSGLFGHVNIANNVKQPLKLSQILLELGATLLRKSDLNPPESTPFPATTESGARQFWYIYLSAPLPSRDFPASSCSPKVLAPGFILYPIMWGYFRLPEQSTRVRVFLLLFFDGTLLFREFLKKTHFYI